MQGAAGHPTLRCEQGLAQAPELSPAPDSKRQIGVLCGSLHLDVVRVDEEQVARRGADQQDRRVACGSLDGREHTSQRPEHSAIR